MGDSVRIGMIGLDTSHCPAFTGLLNDPNNEFHVPGGKVVAAFPGGSPDFDLSINRVEGFTNTLRDDYGVEIMDSPAAVAEATDVVFIESCDGRVHLDQLKETIPFKRPTFIDKPLAVSSAHANEIMKLAKDAGIPLLSASALRFDVNLQAAVAAEDHELGKIVQCDVWGPMSIQPTQPGLFWYGIHSTEILSTIMGTGCKSVQADTNEHVDIVTCTWGDGRVCTIRGNRNCHGRFGCVIHREGGAEFIDCSGGPKPYYACMLEAVMPSLTGGALAIDPADTLEIIRLIEAANQSRETGAVVEL